MIGIPAQPYDETIDGLLKVEPAMKLRKSVIQQYLNDKSEKLITLSSYPRLGMNEFSKPYYRPKYDEEDGYSINTEKVIYPNSRFQWVHITIIIICFQTQKENLTFSL